MKEIKQEASADSMAPPTGIPWGDNLKEGVSTENTRPKTTNIPNSKSSRSPAPLSTTIESPRILEPFTPLTRALPRSVPIYSPRTPRRSTTRSSTQTPVYSRPSISPLDTLSVLKEECRRRDLSDHGSQTHLLYRLQAYELARAPRSDSDIGLMRGRKRSWSDSEGDFESSFTMGLEPRKRRREGGEVGDVTREEGAKEGSKKSDAPYEKDLFDLSPEDEDKVQRGGLAASAARLRKFCWPLISSRLSNTIDDSSSASTTSTTIAQTTQPPKPNTTINKLKSIMPGSWIFDTDSTPSPTKPAHHPPRTPLPANAPSSKIAALTQLRSSTCSSSSIMNQINAEYDKIYPTTPSTSRSHNSKAEFRTPASTTREKAGSEALLYNDIPVTVFAKGMGGVLLRKGEGALVGRGASERDMDMDVWEAGDEDHVLESVEVDEVGKSEENLKGWVRVERD